MNSNNLVEIKKNNQTNPNNLGRELWKYVEKSEDLENMIHEIGSISLQEMDSVALMNRIDTKFVISKSQLLSIMKTIPKYYQILQIDKHRMHHYRTLYYDTPNFDLFKAHVNGKSNRYKIRSREYSDSNLSFFEVKHHLPSGRTEKVRISTPEIKTTIPDADYLWLCKQIPYPIDLLEAKLWNSFTRMTFVNYSACERITIDFDLAFFFDDKIIYLGDVVVAEVKKESSIRNSPFITQLRRLGVRSSGFSKYCLGISLIFKNVKANNFKPRILQVHKIAKNHSVLVNLSK